MALLVNPIQYSSRTFDSILADINTDTELINKPSWWKRVWAGIGDVISVWLNSIANLLFLRTAYTRGAVYDLCELIDYSLAAHTTSSGTLLFYVKSNLGAAIFPFTVSVANLKAKSTGSIAVSSKDFEARAQETFTAVTATATRSSSTLSLSASIIDYTGHLVRFTTTGTLPAPLLINTDYYVIRLAANSVRVSSTLADAYVGNYITLTDGGSGTHTITLYSKAVTCYQQSTPDSSSVIGRSDGTTEFQEFDLPDTYIIPATISIVINSVTWTAVDSLVDSINTDTHYKIIPKNDNLFSVRFGNGTYGAIPGSFDIYASYSYGGGEQSNVLSLNNVSMYAGSDTNISAVSNPVIFTGGAEAEPINQAKILAPMLLKSRDRFITISDGTALVLNYGGVSMVKINKNTYGVLSCQIVGIANGGGDVSSVLRAEIQQYLIDRSILGEIDIRFVASTITPVSVSAQVSISPDYTWATVKDFVELALKLFLSETGQEIRNDYDSNGVSSATTLINSIFSTSYTEANYNQIDRLVSNLDPATFGRTIQSSDLISYIDSFVYGVSYLTISAPSFPLSFANTEISTNGTLTVTQIT